MIDKLKETIHPLEGFKTIYNELNIDIAIYEEEEYFVINFQGTSEKEDWLGNFSLWWKPYKDMNKLFFLHYGFIKRYHLIRDELHKRFKESGKNKLKIRGYSHGGALGTICYADFMWHKENEKEYKDIELDGFVIGSPRITAIFKGREFNRLCKGLINLQNNNDLVTRVPFVWMLYRHVGDIHLLGERRFWPLTALSVAEHSYQSYNGYLKNKNYIDTIDNNFLLEKAKKIMPLVNIGLLLILSGIIGLIL